VTTRKLADRTKIQIELELAGLWVDEIRHDGEPYTTLTIPECGSKGLPGQPNMPFRSLLLPVASGPQVAEVTVGGAPVPILHGVTVVPGQAPQPDDGSAPTPFARDEALYSEDEWWPQNVVEISDDIVVRGQRFLILEISPLQFNPAQLKVVAYPRLEIEISFVGAVDKAAGSMKMRRSKPFFSTSLDGQEPGSSAKALTANPSGVEYLIIAHDDFLAAIEPLATWKRLKGYTVQVVAMSSIGTTSDDIQRFLQSRYDNDPDLTYVLLAGDHEQVPAEEHAGPITDHFYSCLDGEDDFPDVVLGRVSVQTAADCSNVVDKIVSYDRYPNQGLWHRRFLMAAVLQDFEDNDCEADRWFFETATNVMHYARDYAGMGAFTAATSDNLSCDTYMWQSYSYPHRISGYPGQPVPPADAALLTDGATATQDLLDAINAGVGIVLHRDHGDVTLWSSPYLDTSDIATLSNGTRYPVVFSINCETGAFYFESLAEAFLRQYPGGAVGVIAASGLSYTVYNDLLTHGIFDSLWNGYDSSDGGNIYPHSLRPAEALLYGKYYMHHWTGGYHPAPYQRRIYHWHGDPEMALVLGVPQAMNVTIDGPIEIGDSQLGVTCDKDGALVAVTDHGNLLGRAYVAGGTASVTLSPPPPDPTTLDVVASGQGLVPWQGSCEVVVPAGPWLIHSIHTIDDSIGGNGDGLLNPGESVVVSVTVENVGVESATGISSILTTSSPHCTITDGTADFPEIAVAATATSLPNHFSYSVDPAATNGEMIGFNLDWSADGGFTDDTGFATMVCSPLQIANVTVTETTESSARITWTTSAPATSRVRYGTATPLQQLTESSSLTTSHSVLLSELDGCNSYLFELVSESPGCYQVTDSNAGAYYSFTTGGRKVIFFDNVELGPYGWTTEPSWAITDEASYSGSYSWTDSPGGGSVASAESRLTTPVIDLTGIDSPELRFVHTHSFRNTSSDYGYVEASIDNGSTWSILAEFRGELDTWTVETIDLSAFAGSSSLQLGFRIDISYGKTKDGWYIDDIEVSAARSCAMGTIRLDQRIYPCDSSISITVSDLDLNTNDTVQETAAVLIASDTEPSPEMVWVNETGTSSPTFTGTIETTSTPVFAGRLSMADGDTITASYQDVDDGSGHPATATTTARADCAPPVVRDVQVPFLSLFSTSALVTWRTDELATSVVTIQGLPPVASAGGLDTEHAVHLINLRECTTYPFSVTSCDRWGYCATDDNGGAFYQLETPTADTALSEDFEGTAPGWSHGGIDDQWQLGTMTVGPSAPHSGSGVYATNLTGPYAKGNGSNGDSWLQSPVIDLTNVGTARLSFWHWYHIYTEQPVDGANDGAWLEITTDGGASWQVMIPSVGGYNNTLPDYHLAPRPSSPCWAGRTSDWQLVQADLSRYTGAMVQLRFRFWEYDDYGDLGYGWYIDDVHIDKSIPCGPYPVHLSHMAQETVLGNGDGVIDPGEQILLPVTVTNAGTETAGAVTGRLSSGTTGVSIEIAESAIPDLAPAATAQAATPYLLRLDDKLRCGSLIELELVTEFNDQDINPGQSQSSFSLQVGSGIPAVCHPYTPITLDRELYACDDLVSVRVVDPDLDLDPGLPDTAPIELSSDTQPLPQVLVLTETGPSTGIFTGELAISPAGGSGLLQVSEADTIAAVYHDQSAGGVARDFTALASVSLDCTPPEISELRITGFSATMAVIRWTTDEPADSLVEWGATPSLGMSTFNANQVQSHEVVISGLSECTPYYFRISSADGAGNSATDDNNGSLYLFRSGTSQLILSRDFEGMASGWSHFGIYDQWQLGVPTSGPGQAHSGNQLFATNLSGPYTKSGHSFLDGDSSLVSEAIDLSGLPSATLSFWHWYDIYAEHASNSGDDGAWLEISADDGITWQVVNPDGGYNNTLDWQAPHPYGPCWAGTTSEWQLVRVDLTPYVGSTIRLRFRFFEDDSSGVAGDGWYIDDLSIEVGSSCGPSLSYLSHQIIDSPPGNSDGLADPGEQITLPLTLSNLGIGTAFSVTGRISSLTPGVTVDVSEASFPDITQWMAEVSSSPHFRLTIDVSVECNSPIELELEISSADADGVPRRNFHQLTIDLGSIGIPVAILDLDYTSCKEVSYFGNGYCSNKHSEWAAVLDADPLGRFATTVTTSLDPGLLANVDVLVLPDNLVPDDDLAAVSSWFTSGKTIIAAEIAAHYAAYSGLLWPSAAGSTGIGTHWTAGIGVPGQKVIGEDPITSDYELGQELDTSGIIKAVPSELPADSIPLLATILSSNEVTVVYRDIPGRGRIILMGSMAKPPDDCGDLVRAAAASVSKSRACHVYDPFAIFRDGFESGDTTAWSSSVH
jgi:hypothetical protein